MKLNTNLLQKLVALFVVLVGTVAHADFTVIRDGKPAAEIFVDARGAEGAGPVVLKDAGQWLAHSLQKATGVQLRQIDDLSDKPTIIVARADAWSDVAKAAGLKSDSYDAYCIVTQPKRVYVLGNSEAAARHGVANLLRHWGFRWFAPSSKWWYTPKLTNVSINLNLAEAPALDSRRVWYAYGMPGDDLRPLMENYQKWTIANRLGGVPMQTGHSYGNIILRNKDEFEAHPEYFALMPDGKRDNERAVNARKFCISNAGLIELVTRDRLKLLEANRKSNPAAFMVSVDPSDGQGTCHCENCEKLGTTTDRVFHLANVVARGLREKHADAWVGLYAYSSHRLPPTIDVEPNVYVQVAMGFNRTQYTLPELVEAWSKKVGAIGQREYYGVEAWDWGLPGRMRGARVDYHRKWIPFYAERKLNAINAETNANWGAQTLGLYVSSRMMWNPRVDVDSLVEEFFTLCFAEAAVPMRHLYRQFDEAPTLRSATLLPLFRDVQGAWELCAKSASTSADVKKRIVDMMAYLVYVSKFRDFSLAQSRSADRGDDYYAALKPLMNYAWRIRRRDMVHYYALARRLCNGLPVQDKRPDFYLFNKEHSPVWQEGDSLTDEEIFVLFRETIERLESDKDPTVAFSRYLEPVRDNIPGADAGPSGIANEPRRAVARFRHSLRGYLIPPNQTTVRFALAPTSRSVSVTVYLRGDTILYEREFRRADNDDPLGSVLHDFEIELPKANEYRVEFKGDFVLQVPKETPFVFEASVTHPAWVDYSGPHYIYVPRGTRELIVDANPRLSLIVPSEKKRIDVSPADRLEGQQHVAIKVPDGAAGRVWHTSNQTRGKISLLNIPPLLSFHRNSLFIPREVAEADGITTNE